MQEMIETIRTAATDGATPDQKAAGAVACRAILAALEAEPGKALVLPGAPTPGPLAGLSPEQALDLVIARLSAVADAKDRPAQTATGPRNGNVDRAGLRIAFVQPPARALPSPRRKP
jgi:hypothetical protein